MLKLSVSVPGFRHWVSGGALLGFVLTIYNVLLSMTQIAQAMVKGLPVWWWILSGIGVVLSIAAWYALARNNAQTAEAKADAERKHIEILQIKTVVERETAKVLSAVESITNSRVPGTLVYGDQLQRFAETVKSSAATISAITMTPGTGSLVLTGYAPEISTGPSVKSSGAHRP